MTEYMISVPVEIVELTPYERAVGCALKTHLTLFIEANDSYDAAKKMSKLLEATMNDDRISNLQNQCNRLSHNQWLDTEAGKCWAMREAAKRR